MTVDTNNPSSDDTVKTVTVALVDDSPLTRMSLKTAFRLNGTVGGCRLSVVGEAEDGQQAITLATEKQPDVMVMDIGMPLMDGIQATRQIKALFPQIQIVMLTSHEDESELLDAFRSGATSYCLKETPAEQLASIVTSTANGACWIEPRLARYVLNQLPGSSGNTGTEPVLTPEAAALRAELTERELEVLTAITDGLNNQEIADRLYISLNTVKTHLKNIFQKLSVEDRTAAALKALRENLV